MSLERKTTINYFLAHCLYIGEQEMGAEQLLIKIPTCHYATREYDKAMLKLRQYAESKGEKYICNIETPLSLIEYELLYNNLKVLV